MFRRNLSKIKDEFKEERERIRKIIEEDLFEPKTDKKRIH